MPSRNKVGRICWIVLLLAAMQVVSAFADEPDTPAPGVTETPVASPTPAITPEEAITDAETPAVEPEATGTATATHVVTSTVTSVTTPTSTVEPAVLPTSTVVPTVVTIAPTISPTPVPTHTPTPVPTPTPFPTAAPSGTAHIAVLISEAVIPVNGTASSEVFVSLKDVRSGVQGFELHIIFDPEIVQVVDADGDPANGVQIAAATFFTGSQRIDVNQADNTAGEIVFALTQDESAPIHHTSTWKKVATIAWVAQKEGNSVVAVDLATQFVASDGRRIPPDATHDGVVFARTPGKIEGLVRLQGREEYQGVLVSSSLATARVDKDTTDENGYFEIATSYGEGFYTLTISMPGYLSAESDSPIKMTVGNVVDIGEVTLFGGDVNGDNRIDIRDLSYVAWHFDEYDAQADVNGDGQVDILDLSLTAGNFGRNGPTSWQVPEQVPSQAN